LAELRVGQRRVAADEERILEHDEVGPRAVDDRVVAEPELHEAPIAE
jgi:hypothetical protein